MIVNSIRFMQSSINRHLQTRLFLLHNRHLLTSCALTNRDARARAIVRVRATRPVERPVTRQPANAYNSYAAVTRQDEMLPATCQSRAPPLAFLAGRELVPGKWPGKNVA